MGRGGSRQGLSALLVALFALAGLAIAPPAAHAAAPTRPIPPPLHVTITADAFEPADFMLAVGQSVEFVNGSGAPQTVTADDGTFDSGPIPAGGAYGMAIGAAGSWSYASANNAALAGTIVVGVLDIGGDPAQLVKNAIPDLAYPNVYDMDSHPELLIDASRSRIQVAFKDGATVAQANDALAASHVTLIGGLPTLNIALVAVDDAPVEGDFAPVTAALESLRSHPAVAAAALDLAIDTSRAPKPPESALAGGDATDKSKWTWQDSQWPDGNALGAGGNWGIESSRFPQAWNLLEKIEASGSDVQTLVIDTGFKDHPDLTFVRQTLCRSGSPTTCTKDPITKGFPHGTHVVGTIGALFDNPKPGQAGHALGVDGANPAARIITAPVNGIGLAGTGAKGTGFTISGETESFAVGVEGKATGRWPAVRVINLSLGEFDYTKDPIAPTKKLWGRFYANKHCGPSDHDDAGSTGPCTPQTLDAVRHEIAWQGAILGRVAMRASQLSIMIVNSAGNESDKICVVGNTVKQPPCAAGQEDPGENSALINAWGVASDTYPASAGTNPIIVVEAVDQLRRRAIFSNTNGDVSAPGVDVLSTVDGGKYGTADGTSMAAPHVTALVGYLASFQPSLSLAELRRLVIDYATPDAENGARPRLDAFNSVLGIPGASKTLADLNDASVDGNERVTRGPHGSETANTNLGPIANGAQLHAVPDGNVDMRDFRRFRDAQLEVCLLTGAGAASNCPNAAAINLDGGPDHPKKDLNFDGCMGSGAVGSTCPLPEQRFSRFDLNGDGHVDLTRTARLPLQGTPPTPTAAPAAGEPFHDLDMIKRWWNEPKEGWKADDLDNLIKSADIEVHAGALFDAGAHHVDVEARYGPANTLAPIQKINGKNGVIVVTVPVADNPAGSPVSIVGIGRKADGTKLVSSLVEQRTLRIGEDTRADLCTPTVTAKPAASTVDAGAGNGTLVNVEVKHCDTTPLDGVEVEFGLLRSDGTPATAGLSAPSARTSASGRVTVRINAGEQLEKLKFTAKAFVEVDPDADGLEQITGSADVSIVSPPRVIYRWEQTTTNWFGHRHQHDDGNGFVPDTDLDIDITGATPQTISRSGSLTPIGDTDARLVEDVPANPITWHFNATEHVSGQTSAGDFTEVIPTVKRHKDIKLSTYAVKIYDDVGDQLPINEFTFGQTAFTTADDKISVHHFNDVGGVAYGMSNAANDPCTLTCFDERDFDQVAVNERKFGSAIEFAPDVTKDLTFSKLPNGQWSTYVYCGQPHTYNMRGYNGILNFKHTASGVATSRARFVATIVTDDTTDPSTLEFGDCANAKPPISAISRFPIEPNEGQSVHFVDASSDPNGDVVTWEWDFGDGGTSTEQFPDHVFTDDGTYAVTLKVTDATGRSDTASVDVTVKNVTPVVSAEDVAVGSGEAVTVPLSLSDPGARDAEALVVALSSTDAAVPTYPAITAGAGNASLNLGILPDGTHPITIKVTDKDGAFATDQFTVSVGESDTNIEPDSDTEWVPAPHCDFGVKLDLGEGDLVDQVAQYRTYNSLSTLYPSPTLTAAAEAQVAYLRDHDQFSHTGDGGSTPKSRAIFAGYPGSQVGENLARGTTSATGALTAWKSSPDHDANLLRPEWNAIGVAKVTTTHGTLWATVFGNEVDCPDEPPDLGPPGGGPDPVIAPNPPNPPIEVLGWHSTALTGAAPPAPTATLVAETVPIAAFTVSNAAPSTGASVTIFNRSNASAPVDFGDGRPPTTLAASASLTTNYVNPGTVTAQIGDASLHASLDVAVGGAALPPTVTNDGPTAGAQQATVTLAALVKTTANVPVAGRAVDFGVAGKVAHGVTDAGGHATANVKLDVAAGPYSLKIDVPALPGPGVAATSTVPFTVTANAPPVATAGGPYNILFNDSLSLDATGSFDPEAGLIAVSWDLNNDGTFGDIPVFGPVTTVSGAQVAQLVCGGTCTPGVANPIKVRIRDDKGAETDASSTVTLKRDFGLQTSPTSVTLNPGGSVSLQVSVITTSGFTQPVALFVPGLPTGVTVQFSPSTVTPNGTSLLTVTAAANAAKVTAPLVVRGVGGGITHDATGTVDVEFGLVPQCFTALDIHVVDTETNLPLAGVFGSGNAPPTDANGNTREDHIGLGPGNAPATVFLNLTKGGYLNVSGQQLVGCGVIGSFSARMQRIHQGSLEGRIVVGIPDPNNHNPNRKVTATDTPIPGATIHLGVDFVADANGHYSIPNIPVGSGPALRNMEVSKAGFGHDTVTATIAPDVVNIFDAPIVKDCTGFADVRVLNEITHKPIAGIRVSMDTTDPGPDPIVMTGADGRVRFDKIPLGIRNSTVGRSVSVGGTVNGFPVGANSSVQLFDCGSTGLRDVLLHIPTERHASLQGTVRDDTGAPVANVGISNPFGLTLVTDANGHYSAPNVLLGLDITAKSITIGAFPHDPTLLPSDLANLVLLADKTTTFDFVVVHQKFATIDVLTRDAVTHEPLGGVKLLGLPGFTETGPDGRVHATGVLLSSQNRPAQYRIFGVLDGYFFGEVDPVVTVDPPGNAQSVTIDMLRMCDPVTITGRVVNASTGAAIEGAQVSFDISHFTNTDAAGHFVLTDIQPAKNQPFSATLSASKPGFFTASRTVTVFCGAHLTIDFGDETAGTGAVHGKVTKQSDGTAVAGATVGGEWGTTTTSAADGTYAFTGVPIGGEPAGGWSVQVVPSPTSGLDSASKPVVIAASSDPVLNFVLGAPPVNHRPVGAPQHFDVAANVTKVTVTLTGTDTDNDPLTFRAFAAEGGTLDTATGATRQFTLTADSARFFYVVSDRALDSDPKEITVSRATVVNLPPAVSATGADNVPEGSFVNFGSTSNDPDGNIVSRVWDLDGDGQFDDATGTGPQVKCLDNGPIVGVIKVTDNGGKFATATATINCINVIPVPGITGATVASHFVQANAFTDPGADTWLGSVDWGDGTGSVAPALLVPLALSGKNYTLDHTFAQPGPYIVTVKICDDDLGCGTNSATINVTAGTATTTTTTVTTTTTTVPKTSTSLSSTSTTSSTSTSTSSTSSTSTTSAATSTTTTTGPGSSTTTSTIAATTSSTIQGAGSTTSTGPTSTIAAQGTTTSSTGGGVTTSTDPGGSSGSPLPFTGSGTGGLLFFALVCLAAGAGLARRRRT